MNTKDLPPNVITMLDKVERERFIKKYEATLDCSIVLISADMWFFKAKNTLAAYAIWLAAKADAKEQAKV